MVVLSPKQIELSKAAVPLKKVGGETSISNLVEFRFVQPLLSVTVRCT